MDSDLVPSSDRASELRKMLVATASAAHLQRPRPTRKTVIAAILAFLLAGALTGGVVSAAALANADHGTVTVDVAGMPSSLYGLNLQLLGTPFIYVGQGKTVIELGEKPRDADVLALSFRCIDPGSFEGSIDSMPAESIYFCSAGDLGGSGQTFSVPGNDNHTLAIDVPGSARYSIWASWAQRLPDPEPSVAQKTELADGQVTREEYVNAFNRFNACMTGAGYPVVFIDTSETIISYSTTEASVAAGADNLCYKREFGQVDAEWQIAHEDSSETATFVRGCLIARGISPEETLKKMLAQLSANQLTIDQCMT